MVSADARLYLRIDANDKAGITRAAALRGVPVTVFVRSAVMRDVDMAIAAESTVTLSSEESRRFLAMLDAPFQPDQRLKRAMAGAAKLSCRPRCPAIAAG